MEHQKKMILIANLTESRLFRKDRKKEGEEEKKQEKEKADCETHETKVMNALEKFEKSEEENTNEENYDVDVESEENTSNVKKPVHTTMKVEPKAEEGASTSLLGNEDADMDKDTRYSDKIDYHMILRELFKKESDPQVNQITHLVAYKQSIEELKKSFPMFNQPNAYMNAWPPELTVGLQRHSQQIPSVQQGAIINSEFVMNQYDAKPADNAQYCPPPKQRPCVTNQCIMNPCESTLAVQMGFFDRNQASLTAPMGELVHPEIKCLSNGSTHFSYQVPKSFKNCYLVILDQIQQAEQIEENQDKTKPNYKIDRDEDKKSREKEAKQKNRDAILESDQKSLEAEYEDESHPNEEKKEGETEDKSHLNRENKEGEMEDKSDDAEKKNVGNGDKSDHEVSPEKENKEEGPKETKEN